MTGIDVPPERDLPAGRLTQLKDQLMTQIEHELDTEPRKAPVMTHRRWRRIGLAAAALVAVAAVTSVVLGGDKTVSANTVERNDDGSILITIREGRHPEDLERRLNDLGVPAVVDFLETGQRCDLARSTGWVDEAAGSGFFAPVPDTGGAEDGQIVLDPDQLEPGQIAVFEFQIKEYADTGVSVVWLGLSTSEVGPCVPVPLETEADAEPISGG